VDASLIHAVWTVLLLIIFIGIVGWVFVVRRRSDFEQAARIPLDDEPEKDEGGGGGKREHG